MPAGVRLKKRLNTMPNLSSGRAKETAGRVPSPDRRRKGGRESPRGRRSEHESGGSEPYRRERSPGRKSDSAVKAEHHRLVRERDVREAGTKGSFRERRRADDDARGVREEEKSLRVRAPSRKSPVVEEKHTGKDVSAARRGKFSDAGLSQRKPSYAKQRNFKEDDSDAETGSVGEAPPLRGHRGKMDDNRGGKDSDRSKRMGANAEVSSDKFRFMGKKRDGFISRDKSKVDDQVKYRENHARSKGERMVNDGHLRKRLEKKNDWHDTNESVRTVFEDLEELKRHQARLPEKPGKRMASRNKFSDVEPLVTDAPPDKGKRIASRKKSSDVESAATDTQLKKRKRIKLDPYDTSNKRLDDTVPDEDHVEKTVAKEIKISMNAQFRSIQPNHSILSFVEDNLLGRRRLIELQNAGYNLKLSAPLDNVPFSTSTERGRMEENIFRNKLEFFAAAKISSSFPPPTIPEIAFAGRSNVGKSSLLNALTRQWGVVRTSDKPGYTQTINFFRLASRLCLVDLPGYGFAYAKEEVKDAWEELVKEYVSTRVGLQRVCLLIDTKWGMKPRDHELIDLMERSETPYQIILTKTDAVFPIDVARRAMQIEENLNKNKSIVNPVMMVSSTSGAGIRSLRTMLAKLARFIKP